LKAEGALVSPSGITTTQMNHNGLECSLPFISSRHSNKMICMPEVDFGVDSCFSWCIEESRDEQKQVTVFL